MSLLEAGRLPDALVERLKERGAPSSADVSLATEEAGNRWKVVFQWADPEGEKPKKRTYFLLREGDGLNVYEARKRPTLVAINIGYELRCAPPIAFDLAYTRDLGHAAVATLLSDELYQDPGVLVAINAVSGQIRAIPFGELADETGRTRVRRVDISSPLYQSARDYMIRLEKEDLEDEETARGIAQAAGMEVAAFRQRFGPIVEMA